MAWFYEILGKDDEVVEASEPVYAFEFEAQYAAYTRMKEKPSLFGPVPMTGGKVEGGLRSVAAAGTSINMCDGRHRVGSLCSDCLLRQTFNIFV
jgi:hypothetical protein